MPGSRGEAPSQPLQARLHPPHCSRPLPPAPTGRRVRHQTRDCQPKMPTTHARQPTPRPPGPPPLPAAPVATGPRPGSSLPGLQEAPQSGTATSGGAGCCSSAAPQLGLVRCRLAVWLHPGRGAAGLRALRPTDRLQPARLRGRIARPGRVPGNGGQPTPPPGPASPRDTDPLPPVLTSPTQRPPLRGGGATAGFPGLRPASRAAPATPGSAPHAPAQPDPSPA